MYYLMQNAIICPHNEDVNKINQKIVNQMKSTEWISYSADTPCEEEENIPVDPTTACTTTQTGEP